MKRPAVLAPLLAALGLAAGLAALAVPVYSPLADDNGDYSFYQQAVPKLLGRSAKGTPEIEVLVDLLVKRRRLRPRTEALLEVIRERGEAVDPAAAQRLRRAVRTNRRRYRETT